MPYNAQWGGLLLFHLIKYPVEGTHSADGHAFNIRAVIIFIDTTTGLVIIYSTESTVTVE